MKLLVATDLAVPAVGAVGAAALAAAGCTSMASGAVCGTVLAAVGWFLLRLLGRRLVRSGSKSQPLIAVLMGFKLMLMALLVWIAVGVLHFDGIGLAVGLSALPAGILVAVAVAGRSGSESTMTSSTGEVEGDA